MSITASGWAGIFSMAAVNRVPAIAYTDNAATSVRCIGAADANGTSGNPPQIVASTGTTGEHVSLAVLPDNVPLAACHDYTNGEVKAAAFHWSTLFARRRTRVRLMVAAWTGPPEIPVRRPPANGWPQLESCAARQIAGRFAFRAG